MKGSFTFTGGPELAANLRALPKAVSRSAAIDALLEAADPMVTVARRTAPREPGAPDIADNIEARPGRGGKDEFGDERMPSVAWGPVKGFYYGYFQEFGTVKHSAQPFMRPAFDSQKERSISVLMRRLWENIQSFVQSRDVR